MSEDKFLAKVYDLDAGEKVDGFYNDWSASYEAEVAENGYVTPGRCAEALKSIDPALSGPVLDLGCGTGLSGLALRSAGFEPIDGVDFSAGMLEVAGGHGCYRNLWTADLSEPLFEQIPEPETPYAHAVAAGVFSPSHAPASAIYRIMEILPTGGVFVFSLNDHALAEGGYETAIMEVVDGGWASVAFKEHGDHMPGKGLMATVYGLQRR